MVLRRFGQVLGRFWAGFGGAEFFFICFFSGLAVWPFGSHFGLL